MWAAFLTRASNITALVGGEIQRRKKTTATVSVTAARTARKHQRPNQEPNPLLNEDMCTCRPGLSEAGMRDAASRNGAIPSVPEGIVKPSKARKPISR